MKKKFNNDSEKKDKVARGKRIKGIRENELKMNKTQLGKEIGVSSQFLGLVEEGKGNLVYSSIKKLRDLSGHSADYILFGLDDSVIKETKKYLDNFSDNDIISALEIIKELCFIIRKNQ